MAKDSVRRSRVWVGINAVAGVYNATKRIRNDPIERVGETSCGFVQSMRTWLQAAWNGSFSMRFRAKKSEQVTCQASSGRYRKRETDRRDNATGNWRFHCIMADFRFLARNDSVRLVTFIMAFKNMNGVRSRASTRAFGRTWSLTHRVSP